MPYAVRAHRAHLVAPEARAAEDRVGVEHVRADAELAALQRHDPAQLRLGGLAHAVRAELLAGRGHVLRRVEDDAAAGPLLLHDPQRRAGDEEVSARVDGERAIPIGGGQHVEAAERRDAGVADDDVDAAVRARSSPRTRARRPLRSTTSSRSAIARRSPCFSTIAVRDLLGQRDIDVGDDDMRAFLGESLRASRGRCRSPRR